MIDILIPVLGRPDQIEPLAESAKVTQTPHRLLFICNERNKTDIAACEPHGEVMVVPWKASRADFAMKINYAFAHTSNEWLFQGATDIRFSEMWDVHAIGLGRSRQKGVVGTNDLHNPDVRRGKHSTHLLFSREYIERYGGTEDNSGTVFCELYDHQYVDNEAVEVAKRRGQWIFSRNSIVEHFHPHWLGEHLWDDTYKKATRSSVADRTLYRERLGLSRPGRRRSNRPSRMI